MKQFAVYWTNLFKSLLTHVYSKSYSINLSFHSIHGIMGCIHFERSRYDITVGLDVKCMGQRQCDSCLERQYEPGGLLRARFLKWLPLMTSTDMRPVVAL